MFRREACGSRSIGVPTHVATAHGRGGRARRDVTTHVATHVTTHLTTRVAVLGNRVDDAREQLVAAQPSELALAALVVGKERTDRLHHLELRSRREQWERGRQAQRERGRA